MGARAIRTKALTSKQLASRIAGFAHDKKALDIVILDMRGLVNFCDYFVIATGTSNRHVVAVAEGIDEGLNAIDIDGHFSNVLKRGPGPSSGETEGAWMLLDMGDVVTHIFEPQAREFYGLEHLWQDAPAVAYKPPSKRKKA